MQESTKEGKATITKILGEHHALKIENSAITIYECDYLPQLGQNQCFLEKLSSLQTQKVPLVAIWFKKIF